MHSELFLKYSRTVGYFSFDGEPEDAQWVILGLLIVAQLVTLALMGTRGCTMSNS